MNIKLIAYLLALTSLFCFSNNELDAKANVHFGFGFGNRQRVAQPVYVVPPQPVYVYHTNPPPVYQPAPVIYAQPVYQAAPVVYKTPVYVYPETRRSGCFSINFR